MYELKHSAKGTHWTKKDHKYIRKEGDKYYYKDDMKQKQINEKDQRSEAEMLEAQAVKETEDFFKYMGISPDDPLRDEVFDYYKEGNLNKLYEMRGKISPKEAERQKEANKEITQHNRLRAADQDPAITSRNKSKGSSADAKRWSDFLNKKETEKKQKQDKQTQQKQRMYDDHNDKMQRRVAIKSQNENEKPFGSTYPSGYEASRWSDFLSSKNKEKIAKQTIQSIKTSKSVKDGLNIIKQTAEEVTKNYSLKGKRIP